MAERCAEPRPLFRSGEQLKDAVRHAMLKALPHASPDPAIAFLQWLGVFDQSSITSQSGSVVKTFCTLLEAKLKCVQPAAFPFRCLSTSLTPFACMPPAREICWSCITKWRRSSHTARKCKFALQAASIPGTRASHAPQLLLHHAVLWRSLRRHRHGHHGMQTSAFKLHVALCTSHVTRHTSHVANRSAFLPQLQRS